MVPPKEICFLVNGIFFSCFVFGYSLTLSIKGLKQLAPLLQELVLSDSLAPKSMGAFDQPGLWKNLRRLIITNGILEKNEILYLKNLPAIEHFSLENCLALTSQELGAILPNWPNLQILTLETCPRLDYEILTTIGKHNQKLHTLSLSNSPYAITQESLKIIAGLKELRMLNISNCALTDGLFKLLYPQMSVLHSLNIGANRLLTDKAFSNLPKIKNSDFKQLNLKRIPLITYKTLKRISKIFPALEELNLSACNMTAKACTVIGTKFSSTLKSLNLSKNPLIDNIGLAGIASCKNVRELIANELPISTFSAPGFAQWESLSKISLKKCHKLEDGNSKIRFTSFLF